MFGTDAFSYSYLEIRAVGDSVRTSRTTASNLCSRIGGQILTDWIRKCESVGSPGDTLEIHDELFVFLGKG